MGHSGAVMKFRFRPPLFMLVAALGILALGLLWSLPRIRGEVDPDLQGRGRLVLAVSFVVSGMMIIAVTSKLWFRHLWPHNNKSHYHRRRSRHHHDEDAGNG